MVFAITPGIEMVSNLAVLPADSFTEAQTRILSPQGFIRAKQEITQWPGYRRTPLRELDLAAKESNLANIYYKDESGRFGLGSFKALGGAYAVSNLLKNFLKESGSCLEPNSKDLLSGKYREQLQVIEITCATDGNHGRSVAWGCQQFGCRCIIYIHASVSEGRKQAIEGYGAEVLRVPGNYDDAVRQADLDAKRYGRYVVSDTSYAGYMDVPKDVMQGYTVMADEAFLQLPEGVIPSHIFVQGGVGGLAAAVFAQAWQHFGEQRPHCVVVEPNNACCLFESARQGKPITIDGELDTLMAGLACGEVSLLAWEILVDTASSFLTVSDQSAVDCMRLLAAGKLSSDGPIVAGESAVAGLSALLLASSNEQLRASLTLSKESQIMLIGSEGATDPELYEELVNKVIKGAR